MYHDLNRTALLLPCDSDMFPCIYCKDPILEEKSLELVLLYLQAEYSCTSQTPFV